MLFGRLRAKFSAQVFDVNAAESVAQRAGIYRRGIYILYYIGIPKYRAEGYSDIRVPRR